MFFRNLTFLHYPADYGALLPTEIGQDIAQAMGVYLDECRLKPVGPLELTSVGFVSPFGRDCEQLVLQVGNATLVTAGAEEKLLPPAVVQELLDQRVQEIEEREGRRLGGRMRKRLKDDLVHELLPKAFVQPRRTNAYVDHDLHLLIVDTSSRKVAETVASELRRAIGTFPAVPPNCEIAPRSVLTGWLAGEPMPEGLALGDECELRDGATDGAVVRIQHAELQSDEVAKHLETGMQCTRLGLVLGDHLSFVLGEDMGVRKLRFLDGAVDALENTEADDLRAELDARFALQVGELRRLVELLRASFKVTGPDAAEPAPKPRARRGRLEGVDAITISAPAQQGQPGFSFTLTPRQFETLGIASEQLGEAARIVRSSGKASIASLQRAMKVGYNHAAALIEALEAAGVVSAPDAQGRRTVLVGGQ